MPRPIQPRRIDADLTPRVFKPRGVPVGELESVALTLDGLEAIRLADLESLYQEEGAQRMGVSRATFARVLTEARQTVADAIVNGKNLVIGGGVIERCEPKRARCPIHGGRERRGRACRCKRRGAAKE